MVVREYYKTRADGVALYKTYSTEGFYIKKVGRNFLYTEAIDPSYKRPKYEETDVIINPITNNE